IRALAGDLLDAQAGNDSFDYVQDFAAILPSMVISTLLGVPDEDRAHVHETIDTLFHIEPGVGMINDISFTARIELFEYLTAQLAERETHPRDDMLTDLVTAEITDTDGQVRRLTSAEAVEFAILLVGAGTETVARLLGFAAIVLDEHPDQRAELVAAPELIGQAVEELLRYEAPSPVQGRWTTAPVELHGTVVPANAKVLLLTGSAGRDDRKYADGDRFDIHRSFDHHVSFGYGVHFCLGAALARMEGRIGLEETFKRHPTWQVDRDNAHRLHTSTVRGWTHVPISV
ncbi:MAG TPA: cytochrome P450, partial [Acidimicrobiales bacterium]